MFTEKCQQEGIDRPRTPSGGGDVKNLRKSGEKKALRNTLRRKKN